MPRPKIDAYWRERVRFLVENAGQERLTDQRIAAILEEDARQIERNDCPSPRSVGRIRKAYEQEKPEVRREYRRFSWPGSMESGALPWEAGPAAFELMREKVESTYTERPALRLVKWFWRVSTAIPEAPFKRRLDLATRLALDEVTGEDHAEAAEAYMHAADWESSPGWITLIPAKLEEAVEILQWPRTYSMFHRANKEILQEEFDSMASDPEASLEMINEALREDARRGDLP